MIDFSMERAFEYENGFYLTSGTNRISKFVSHLDFYRMSLEVAGDIVECGVFKGNSLSRWIKFRDLLGGAYSKKIYAFDIFGKFPEAQFGNDIQKRESFVKEAGEYGLSKEKLLDTYEALGLNKNLSLIEGDILETIPNFCKTNPHVKISLLHIDVDLYEPTKCALEYFYPMVTNGGVIIFDDYGAFAGANKAIDDYFANTQNNIIKKLPHSNAISYITKNDR